MDLNQYQIVLVNLDPTLGSEIKKTRPCVVISPNEMNGHLRTVIIAPMSTKSKAYPSRVRVSNSSWVVLDQIRTIDRVRVIKSLGYLSRDEIRSVKAIIKEMLVD